jgi:hypothetical protein
MCIGRARRVVAVAIILACLAVGASAANGGRRLVVPKRAQQESNWCWAACAQMVMEKGGHSVTQCAQAINRCLPNPCACAECASQGANPCSANPSQQTCNTGGWPDFPCFGFTSYHTNDAALSWGSVKSEIDANRPFLATWRFTNLSQPSNDSDDGHMVVAMAYKTVGRDKFLIYIDPLTQGAACGATEEKMITYEAYRSGPSWTHWDDYYGIKKVAPKNGCVAATIQQASR